MDRERCWLLGEVCVAQLDAIQKRTGLGARWARSDSEEEGSDASKARGDRHRYRIRRPSRQRVMPFECTQSDAEDEEEVK